MGALHEGHLSLIRQSQTENDVTICSIFVNPIQFDNLNDLEQYPRMPGKDARLLEVENCTLLFTPDEEEMLPKYEKQEVKVDFGMLDKVLEGKYRPGHFKGVAIIVKKLLGIINPDRAYFGKKDFQQLVVIRHMVHTLGLPVQIITCETVRESDGLALSSRNIRLTIGERKLAPLIYEILCKAKQKVGKIPVWELKEWAIKKIQENPEFRVEYFEIADKETMLPMENWERKEQAIALTAVYLGDVRLIDNIELFS
jgi:pantoate--beta-alanine ligase